MSNFRKPAKRRAYKTAQAFARGKSDEWLAGPAYSDLLNLLRTKHPDLTPQDAHSVAAKVLRVERGRRRRKNR